MLVKKNFQMQSFTVCKKTVKKTLADKHKFTYVNYINKIR